MSSLFQNVKKHPNAECGREEVLSSWGGGTDVPQSCVDLELSNKS
ncbi:hypothetical protein PFLA_b0873 [Pseudoalteromonas flavipulchra NCIMB 2033 = ATCC BAA-314]|nr:hypothetical protein [Pseudoalteromonas flavipulchra NCIMB 2033 = ATCC BAA-314]